MRILFQKFKFRTLEDFALPRIITEITGQSTVPIGDGVIATKDTVLGNTYLHTSYYQCKSDC